MSSLVLTSLNPHSKIGYQLRCFEAWAELGADIRTVNVESEAEKLRKRGVPDNKIISIGVDDTGQAIHGLPAPKITSLFEKAQEFSQGRPTMILNSDLYPAMRAIDVVSIWGGLAPAVALTREECAMPATYQFSEDSPYRGGLDCFVFSPDGLAKVVASVANLQSFDRMCFGIPGWDYMVGAVLLSENIKGLFMDSAVILHASHATTYTNMEEFGNYLADMRTVAGIDHEDPTQGAMAFREIIDRECIKNKAQSKAVKSIFFKSCCALPPPGAPEYDIARVLLEVSPTLGWQNKNNSIVAMASSNIEDKLVDFDSALNLFCTNPDPEFRFVQTLMAILYCRLCNDVFGYNIILTREYPNTSLHGRVVEMILDGYPDGSPYRRLDFAKLFGSELIEHRIFNPYIFNYLVQSCETDEERTLVQRIWTSVEKEQANVA